MLNVTENYTAVAYIEHNPLIDSMTDSFVTVFPIELYDKLMVHAIKSAMRFHMSDFDNNGIAMMREHDRAWFVDDVSTNEKDHFATMTIEESLNTREHLMFIWDYYYLRGVEIYTLIYRNVFINKPGTERMYTVDSVKLLSVSAIDAQVQIVLVKSSDDTDDLDIGYL